MLSFANFLYKLEKMVWLDKLLLWGLIICVVVVFVFSFPFYIAPDLNYLKNVYEPWLFVKYGSFAIAIFFVAHLLYQILSGRWRDYIYGRKMRTGMKFAYIIFMVVVILLLITGIFIGYKFITTDILPILPFGIGEWLAGLFSWFMWDFLVENLVPLRSFVFYVLMADAVLYLYFACLPTYSQKDTLGELTSIVGKRVDLGADANANADAAGKEVE